MCANYSCSRGSQGGVRSVFCLRGYISRDRFPPSQRPPCFSHRCPRVHINRAFLHWLPMSQRVTFKIALMTYDCIQYQCTSATSVHRLSLFPFVLCFALLTTTAWLYHVLGPHVMVRAVSTSRHTRFGTCYHLISRTVMLVANSSSRALRLGSLCKPTHKRRLWELCLSGALQILDLIDWLISPYSNLCHSRRNRFQQCPIRINLRIIITTGKLCCHKETTRCCNCSFHFKVHQQHSLQV